MTAPGDYPDSWKPRGAPQTAAPAAPIEGIMLAIELAIDSYVAALPEPQLQALLARTRG